MATTDNIDLNKPFKWPLSFYNSVQKGSYQMKKTVLNGKLNCFHLRVQEYIKSGRDKVVVDPDPDKIYTKQKNRLSKLPINCSPESLLLPESEMLSEMLHIVIGLHCALFQGKFCMLTVLVKLGKWVTVTIFLLYFLKPASLPCLTARKHRRFKR